MLPRWDLSDLHKSYDEAYANLDHVLKRVKNFSDTYKGKIADDMPDDLLEKSIKEYELILDDLYRTYSYVALDHRAHVKDEEIAKHFAKIQETIAEINTHLVFFTLSINKLSEETIGRCVKKHAPWVKQLRLYKDHELSEEVESILCEKNVTSKSAWIRLFDEMLAQIEFKKDGEIVGLSKILEGMSSLDSQERKDSAMSLHQGLAKNEKLITFIFNTLIQDKMIMDKKRGYKSPMHPRHLDNMIEPEVVETLADSVKENYHHLSHKWYKLKAKIMGQETIHYWDRNAPLFTDEKVNIPYADGKQIVFTAYNEFSPILASIVQKFYDNPWIDVPERDDKDSGAFSASTVPSAHPYILLNYQGKIRDVATLAHELGHGVHQYLAREQGLLMADTPLTVAETASVFGEMLTFDFMKKSGKYNNKMLLASKIDDMINTVTRQISFYEFEKKVHKHRIEKGELSASEIHCYWKEVQTEALGDGIEWNTECDNFWAYVSHFFHVPFYVYAYAFGDCLVNSLYREYQKSTDKKDFEQKYIELLKAGGSKTYKELLQPFNLDPSQKDFWESGLSVIKDMIKELEGLID